LPVPPFLYSSRSYTFDAYTSGTLASPCGGHVFYKGSHGANLKLLKIRGLIDVLITKAREVTKGRNFLGLMFGFVTAMQS
jgi:hypothetical protein